MFFSIFVTSRLCYTYTTQLVRDWPAIFRNFPSIPEKDSYDNFTLIFLGFPWLLFASFCTDKHWNYLQFVGLDVKVMKLFFKWWTSEDMILMFYLFEKYIMLNLQFLETEFLERYLGRWKQDVEGTVGLTQDEKNRMQLSKQTLHGWNLTGSDYFSFAIF